MEGGRRRCKRKIVCVTIVCLIFNPPLAASSPPYLRRGHLSRLTMNDGLFLHPPARSRCMYVCPCGPAHWGTFVQSSRQFPGSGCLAGGGQFRGCKAERDPWDDDLDQTPTGSIFNPASLVRRRRRGWGELIVTLITHMTESVYRHVVIKRAFHSFIHPCETQLKRIQNKRDNQ